MEGVEKMTKISGKSVYEGIALGKILVLQKTEQMIRRRKIEDPKKELVRLQKAVDQSQKELRQLYEKAAKEAGENEAAIFEVHQMMLEDDDYRESIEDMIRKENLNAEYAVNIVCDRFYKIFDEMDDEYMRARAADIRDISDRLTRNLTGHGENDYEIKEPSIIIADDLSPSETIQMDQSKVLAFVTVHGSMNSHTAILARTMNIPALIQVPVELSNLQNGTMAVVDGEKGELILNPDEETSRRAAKKIEQEREKLQLLQEQKGKESITADGKKVHVYANIGSVSDVDFALDNDADGIGLFRSEFLYLGREDFPTEEEQYQAYREVLERMNGKKVVIRTLDIGADKQADYFNLPEEENPALGYRAIRICLRQPDIFKTQLRALLRAAVHGCLAVMYPMITSADEIRRIQKIVNEVKEELDREHAAYQVPEQGIMIETPAAALISDRLAPLVEFFSIGTNDLTQYTLAIDRRSEILDEFYNPHHEAVLRMIRMVMDNAHKAGIWAGICGELAADVTLTEEFVRMGADELSVAPSSVLKVRKEIRMAHALMDTSSKYDL